MDVTKTLKIQIKPTVEQIALLNETAEVYRNACNFVSENVFKFKLKSKFDMQRLYYHDVRDSFGLMSQMAISVFGTVAAKYKTKAKQDKQNKKLEKNCKHKKKPKPDRAIQFKIPEYDLVYNRDYSINKQYFSISVLNSKAAEAEDRKQVCDLGLLSTSPKCNVTFDSKPKAKRRKKKGAVAQAAVTGQLQTNSL